jgi:sugar phosphate isomerase/epimerase
MARLSMNEITTFRWSFEEDVRNYVAAGIDGIAVWRQKLSDFGEEKGAELLADSPLTVSSLLWAGGFTGSDGRTYKDSVEDAIEATRLAADLNAATLVVYSGSRSGHTHNHARRLFKSALKEMAPVASECGITLAVEPMHIECAGEWTFLTDLDESIELLQSIDSPQAKLTFDAYHLGQDQSVLERIHEIVPLIAIVQLGDAKRPPCGEQNRCRLGDGYVPLKQIVARLTEAGYDGFFDIELLGEDVENSDYAELIEQSKQAFAGLMQPCATP